MASDLGPETADRVEETVNRAIDIMSKALAVRLDEIHKHETSRAKAEYLIDSMIHTGDLATQVEEVTVALIMMRGYLDDLWDNAIAARKSPAPQYLSRTERLAPLIRAYPTLYETRGRVHSALEASQRAVERLTNVHSVASRAAGLVYGQ